jgi:hypothetical protein
MISLKNQKEQLFTALFLARPRPTLAGGGPPTTIGARALTSVFGLRFPIDCGSLRQLHSFGPHVHRTLRASLACFLDLLVPRKPRFFHLRWFVFLILQSYYLFEKQKEQFFTALYPCPATSYSRRG